MSDTTRKTPLGADSGRRGRALFTFLAVALGLALLAGSCVACAPEVEDVLDCDIESVSDELSEDQRAEARPSVSLHIDITRSAKKRRDELSAAVADVVGFAVEREARLSVGTFGATRSSAGPVDCLEDVALVPDGNNGPRREASMAAMPGEITQMVMAAIEDSPREPATDPMAGFIAGADDARRLASGATDTVVILSDFQATTGCLVPDTDAGAVEPDQIVDGCSDLPDMAGLDLAIAGVGRSNPQPSTEQVERLITIAEGVCERTGATCTVTGSHLPELDR